MNKNTLASMLIEDLKTVSVVFSGNDKHYTYKTTLDFEVDDEAVVNTPSGKNKIVKVVEIHEVARLEPNSMIDYKWIICKVDFSEYDKLVELEQSFSNKLRILEQRELKNKAQTLLAESLGIEAEDLNAHVKKLNIEIKE